MRRKRYWKYGMLGAAVAGTTLSGLALAQQDSPWSARGVQHVGRWGRKSHSEWAEGSTLRVRFYADEPAKSHALSQVSYTVGESDDVAAMLQFLRGAQRAKFAVFSLDDVKVDLSRYDLKSLSDHLEAFGEHAGHRGSFGRFGGRGHSAADGATIRATFYAGDPDAGAEPDASLSYVHGQTGEAAALEQFIRNAENAAYVVLSVDDVTIDLEAQQRRSNWRR